MLQKITYTKQLGFIFTSIFFLLCNCFAFSQITINPPTLFFTQVCASQSFNNYEVNFSFTSPNAISASNVFNVELSDASGSFASPTILTTSNSTSSPILVNFPMPTTVNGNNYKIRIRSTTPASISPVSLTFEAHYLAYNNFFSINNGTPAQTFCSNPGYILSIDPGTNSPVQFPFLTYVWLLNGNAIPGESGTSITVIETGLYSCKINYGSCSNDIAQSNFVNLTAIQTPALTISSANNDTFLCPGETILLSSSNTDATNMYQWYKDNLPISGATNSTYLVSQAGDYYLKIARPECDLVSNHIQISSVNVSLVTANYPQDISINPGESVTINATGASSYSWSSGGTVVSNTNSLLVSQAGVITLTATLNGCQIIKTFTVTVTSVPEEPTLNLIIPNTITPNEDGINDTWVLPEELAFQDNVEVVIFSSDNQIVFQSKNYANNWPINAAKANTVYYYKIIIDRVLEEKGTLSVIVK